MSKRLPVIGVITVFLLGILCGSLGMHLLHSYRSDSVIKGRVEPREEMLVNRLESKLKLDSRQLEQVRTIVHETRDGIDALRHQLRPQMEALIDKAHTRIDALLTPEQRVIFERMIAERKERINDRGVPPGGGPP